MDSTEKKLRRLWDGINSCQTGSLRLGIHHTLEWHVAYVAPASKALVILSHCPADDLGSSKSITTACNRRSDGTYYISFQLTEKRQEDVFISMCSNLIDYSADALTEKEAIKRVEFRYREWRRLMEYKNPAVLSDEKRRGLIGELLYLKQVICQGKPVYEALAGWVGPDGADQDFVYDGRWAEIKTSELSSDRIDIHSIEQLGDVGEHGDLVIYRVDPCAPETDGAFTLRKLVGSVLAECGGDIRCVELLIGKLNAVGYVDMELYDKYPYKYFRNDVYDVNDTFPKIVRTDLRPEITTCQYSLSIASIDGWKRG